MARNGTSTVLRPCPTPAVAAALRDVEAATLTNSGSPPITRTTFLTCRAHYPGGSKRVRVSITSPLVQPSPIDRRVGIRIVTFEACLGFTHVTARQIAQPPKATFVTRLQPVGLPGQAARQLPDQSTSFWVDSSSTGDSRLRAHGQKQTFSSLAVPREISTCRREFPAVEIPSPGRGPPRRRAGSRSR